MLCVLLLLPLLLPMLHDPVDGLGRDHDHCGLAGAFHLARGDWALIDNGVLVLGRDRQAGGVLSLLAEVGPDGLPAGPQLVDHWDTGRQIQMNLREAASPGGPAHWNPTQAGDGPHPAFVPGDGPDVLMLHVEPGTGPDRPAWAVSRSRPLDFRNEGTRWPLEPPRPVDDVRFWLTTEFLPDDPRTVFVRGVAVWEPADPSDPGRRPAGQGVLPTIHLPEAVVQGRVMVPMGQPPWLRDDQGAFAHQPRPIKDHARAEGDVADRASEVFPTEGWVYAPGAGGGPGLGVMCSGSTVGIRRVTGHLVDGAPGQAPAGSGDHARDALLILPRELYPVALPPGRRRMVREGEMLLYVGELDDARETFARWRPRPSGSFSKLPLHGTPPPAYQGGETPVDALDDLDLNARGLELLNEGEGTFLRVHPVDDLPADLTVSRRVWGDGVFEVQARITAGGWAGLALRKGGASHALARAGDCVLVLLRPSGPSVSVERRALPHDTAPPLPFVRPEGLPPSGVERFAEAAPPPYAGDGAPDAWRRLRVRLTGSSLQVWVDPDDARPEQSGEAPLIDLDLAALGPRRPADVGHVAMVAAPDGGPVDLRGLLIAPRGDEGDNQPTGLARRLQARSATDGTRVHLSWTNPDDDDWRSTRVVRKPGRSPPAHWRDGLPVYEGRRSDAVDLMPPADDWVTYAAFAMDLAGNPASPAIVSVRVPRLDAPADRDPGSGALRVARVAHLADDGFRAQVATGLTLRDLDRAAAGQPLQRTMTDLPADGAGGFAAQAGAPVELGAGTARIPPGRDGVLAWRAPTCGEVRVRGALALADPHPLSPAVVTLWLEQAPLSGRELPTAHLAHRIDLTDRQPDATLDDAPTLHVCPGERVLLRFGAGAVADGPVVVQHDLRLELLPFFAEGQDPCGG